MLDDGTYDVIIIDANARDDGAIAMDVAVSSGARRGDVVTIIATGLTRDAIDLLAMPATLIIEGGTPRVVF